jgi:polyhydroxyalkanoate synthase subunit PhaC
MGAPPAADLPAATPAAVPEVTAPPPAAPQSGAPEIAIPAPAPPRPAAPQTAAPETVAPKISAPPPEPPQLPASTVAAPAAVPVAPKVAASQPAVPEAASAKPADAQQAIFKPGIPKARVMPEPAIPKPAAIKSAAPKPAAPKPAAPKPAVAKPAVVKPGVPRSASPLPPMQERTTVMPVAAPPPVQPPPAALPAFIPPRAAPAVTPAAPPPAAPLPATSADSYPGNIDLDALTKNFARLVEEGGRAVAAYLKPREDGAQKVGYSDEINDAVKTLGQVMEYWYSDPQRTVEMQTRLGKSYLDLWASAARRLAGEPTTPVATPDPRDKRFNDPEWSSNQYFDFLKQAYLVTADWAKHLVEDADELNPTTRQKADFYMRQLVNAASPSNFVFTNPELLRTTLRENAENLVRGTHMLAEDITAGGGELRIRQSDASKFEVGRNLAVSPGKVIHQNELMQLIQYAPTTETVLRRPVLLVPPWINKFYVLDLAPEKSLIKWCLDNGLTVFCVSWVNPDEHLAAKDFADYMRQGPLEALDVVTKITGETEVNAVGYCVGGTLLAITLAYMAATGDRRIASATLLTTQVDFTFAGDLKVFATSEEQIQSVERQMAERGYLEGAKMATAFNLLRSNDLIWPYVVNNYLKGEAPFPFDLLYWNADATRMPAANHSYYLRNCYLENNLTKGKMTIDGVGIDLGNVKTPVYNLATREDHIAPAKSVYLGSSFFGGPMRFVLSGSGHIAGVVNPPSKQKYQYWTGDTPHGADIDAWLKQATEHPGSWWTDWLAWIKAQDSTEVPARQPGGGVVAPIEDAPGSYVKVRS